MLNELIADHRQEILARTQAKLALRYDRRPSGRDQDHGAELFLEQMTALIRHHSTGSRETDTNTRPHGGELLRRGYSVSRVVHGYGDVCQVITEMAVEKNSAIAANDFRMLNRCLDDAIASAITQYSAERDSTTKDATMRDTTKIHVLSDALSAALMSARESLAAIKDGTVGYAGSTGSLLERSITAASQLNEGLLEQISIFERDGTVPSRWAKF